MHLHNMIYYFSSIKMTWIWSSFFNIFFWRLQTIFKHKNNTYSMPISWEPGSSALGHISRGNWGWLGKKKRFPGYLQFAPEMWNRGKLGMSGKTEKKHSGNVELVETGDILENRERAFWKCRAGGGNWGCLGKHTNDFRVVPSFYQFHISGGNWGWLRTSWENRKGFQDISSFSQKCGTDGNWG